MLKKDYQNYKKIKKKIDSGLASFKERNIMKILEKKRAKGIKVHFSLESIY